MTEPEQPPEHAADDVTVGAWLDTDPPAAVDPTSVVREPVETPGLWDRIKRAVGAVKAGRKVDHSRRGGF